MKTLLLLLLLAIVMCGCGTAEAGNNRDVDFHAKTQEEAYNLRYFLTASAPNRTDDYLDKWRAIAKTEKLYWKIDCANESKDCIGLFQRVPTDGPENDTCGYWAIVGNDRRDVAFGFVESVSKPDTHGNYLHPPPAPPKTKSKWTSMRGYPDRPEELLH